MIIDISSLIPAVSFILYILFTVFGLLQHKQERIRWPFIGYMFAMAVWSFGSFMMHANTGLATPIFWNRFMVAGMLCGPMIIFHSMLDLFEKKRKQYRILLYLGYVICGFLLYLNFRGNIVSKAWFEGNQFYYSLDRGAFIAYGLSYLYLLLCVFILFVEIRRTVDVQVMRKLRLPLFGAIIMLIGVLINIYEPIGRYPIDLFSASINAILIFYAIYRYRLVNYSSFVLRAVLYFVLIVVSAFVFYGIIWIFSETVYHVPFEYAFLPSLVLGAAASVIFQPLRKGTLSFMERLYFGKRFEYNRSLRSFSESLISITDLSNLGDVTIQKVVETFDLEWASMFVLDYTARNYRMIASKGLHPEHEANENTTLSRNSALIIEITKSNTMLLRQNHQIPADLELPFLKKNGTHIPSGIIPLMFKDRLNGCILLGPSKEKDYFNLFEIETLKILAGQCAISLENAISFERLKRQQKKLQALNNELAISRNKLEAFFDGITTPISIQDINYNIIMVNLAATRYFNAAYKDLIGSKCYKMFFGRNKPCENCMAQDCLHTLLPFGIERKEEQANVTFAIHFYPINVPMGWDKLFLEFFQDITQQKRLQEELIQSEKLAGIGTLASGIAHEINNPLAGIIGTAEIMTDILEPGSKLYEYAQDIIKYSRTASEVIKDLTTYSRRERGDRASVNVIDVIESALKLAQRGMKFEGITVEKKYEGTPFLEVNSNELQQVFLNLIINAVQAMEGGGVLSIECKPDAENVYIAINDTGCGIDEKNIDNIFNPFFTTKEPGKGTGLGLSIAQQIIYSLGGRIYVSSCVGEGTQFEIYIPLVEEEKWRIHFTNARRPHEKEDVFFLQRKILVGEKGYLEESIRRKEDEIAYHIVAYKGLQPVGTVSCITPDMVSKFPIEKHFRLNGHKEGKRCVEIDRLAVLREERGSIVPLGLMTLAYLYAKAKGAERLFLDVFSDEKKHINMYKKLGFKAIGEYESPLPVTVMMLDYKTDYEKTASRMEQFVKPFMARLVKRMDFSDEDREEILKAVEHVVTSPEPAKSNAESE